LADPELGTEALDLIRSMITEITVVPRVGADGVDLELAGDLARNAKRQAVAGAGRLAVSLYAVTVVAGSRSHLYRTTLIVERTCS